MQVEKTLDWLPSGWKVEVKERKNGSKDKYYTDMASGYMFRSRREVSHYLQTGELPRMSRKKRFLNDADSISEETSKKKLSGSNTRGYLFTGQSSYTSKRNEEWIFSLSVTEAEESSCLVLFPLDVKDNKENKKIKFCADKRYVLALHTPAVSPVNQLGENGVGKHQNRESQPAPQISETRKELTLPCRTSRRLAGMEPEPIPDVGKYNYTPPAKSGEGVDNTEKDGHCFGEQKNELGKVLHDQIAGEGVDHTENGGHCLGEQKNELGKVLHDQIAGEGVDHAEKGGHCLGEPKNALGKVLHDQIAGERVDHTEKGGHCLGELKNEFGKVLHDQIAGEGVDHTEKGGHCLDVPKNELGKVLHDQISGEGVHHTEKGGHCLGEPKNELRKVLHDQISGEGVDHTEKGGHCLHKQKNKLGKVLDDQIAEERVEHTGKCGHCLGELKNELGKVLHDQIAVPREPSKKIPAEKPESRSTLQFRESFLQKVLQDQGAAPEEHLRKTGSEKPDLQITLRF
ncbi:hypothetical protein FRX31_019532, partial [Thalictrum thalictroides]